MPRVPAHTISAPKRTGRKAQQEADTIGQQDKARNRKKEQKKNTVSNRIEKAAASRSPGPCGGKIGMPLSFGLALAQDRRATAVFSALPDHRKKQLLEQAKTFTASEDLRRFVSTIG